MPFCSAFHTFGNKFTLIIESFCQLRYKNKNLFTLVVLFIIGNVLYIAYANMRLVHWDIFRRSADGDLYEDSTDNAAEITVPDHHRRKTTDPQRYPEILLFLSSSRSNLGKSIGNLLKSVGFGYSQFVWGSGSIQPHLTPRGPALLVFETYRNYLTLPPRRRSMIDRYCQKFGVGIIGFVSTEHNGLGLNGTLEHGLHAHPVPVLEDAVLNRTSPVLRIAKPSGTLPGPLPGGIQTVFSYDNSSRYSAVLTALERHYINDHVSAQHIRTIVVQDLGDGLSGVEKLLIGGAALLDFWLLRVLFLDAVSFLTGGVMILELKRYILVDIDDVFISSPGIGITPADVQALVDGQKRIGRLIPGFTFNLGFCGRFLHSGSDQQRVGADALLAVADQFWWFPHTWDHIQPHKTNYSRLVTSMRRNKQFANDYGISVRHGYSVAPHHSGVYPVDQHLYTAWKQVWDIHQTSTEEYPHLYEPGGRRGFIHNGIRVMPRQTCGLFTHTVFLDKYPNGKHVLEEKIRGGEIFQTILANPISIFMTHQPNYVGDRLALYTMEAAARFIQHWTNLQLHTAPPDQLADVFFNKLFPDQRQPLWGNPCLDRRHVDIWRLSDVCGESGGSVVFPRLLVLGPQKTGSTALHGFLAADPRLKANRPTDTGTFEELQFFSGRNYDRGVDWYLSNFMDVGDNGTLLFEKSATYFDSADAPRRAAALLPDAKLVVILVDPSRRAYSWYQHQRSHNDPIATNNSFFGVITADGHHTPLSRLRNRCLNPGKYAVHLENWLRHFRPSQIHAVDGEMLRTSPVQEMNLFQDFLEIQPSVDFSKLIKYSSRKGYFCPVNVEAGTTRCLGVSKGRRYKSMDTDSAQFLKNYYADYNVQLHELLTRLGWPSPEWLLQLMKASSSRSSSTSVRTSA